MMIERLNLITRVFLWAAVLPLLTLAACGGDDLLLPKDGEPARITAVYGNNQSGTVGQPLVDSLVVEVTDPGGRPVQGVEVLFVAPAGAVLDPGDRVMTGPDGEAWVSYTLSTTAGQQMVEARASAVPEPNGVAVFSLSAAPATATSLVAAGGDGQSAQVSTVLPESLAVRAVDGYGNGVAGIEVSWQGSGGADVAPASGVTGADGRVTTALTLGDRPGQQGATARASDLDGSPVLFTATAVAAPRPELVLLTQPSTTAAAGVPLAQQPVLQLQDPFGAPLNQEGVSVTVQVATGGGSLGGGTTVESSADGRVTFTDLEFRGDTGPKTLIFAADGFTPVTSVEIAVQPGPPAAGETSVSVPDGTAGAATPITIRLRDEFGNNIVGASQALSIRIAGANPTPAIPVDDNGNGSYGASYVPEHSGSDEVILEHQGQPLARAVTSVAAGAADPSTTTAVLIRRFLLVDVIVTTRDAFGNPLGRGGENVQVQSFTGELQAAEDQGDGTYTATLVVGFGGNVPIYLNGVPIAGSPFPI